MLGAGDALVIPPDVLHRITAEASRPVEMTTVLDVRLARTQDSLGRAFAAVQQCVLPVGSRNAGSLSRHFRDACAAKSDQHARLMAVLWQLAAHLADRVADATPTSPQGEQAAASGRPSDPVRSAKIAPHVRRSARVPRRSCLNQVEHYPRPPGNGRERERPQQDMGSQHFRRPPGTAGRTGRSP